MIQEVSASMIFQHRCDQREPGEQLANCNRVQVWRRMRARCSLLSGSLPQIDHHDPVGLEGLMAAVVEALGRQLWGQLKQAVEHDQSRESASGPSRSNEACEP